MARLRVQRPTPASTRRTRERACAGSRSSRGARSLSASDALASARALLGDDVSLSQDDLSTLLAAVRAYTALFERALRGQGAVRSNDHADRGVHGGDRAPSLPVPVPLQDSQSGSPPAGGNPDARRSPCEEPRADVRPLHGRARRPRPRAPAVAGARSRQVFHRRRRLPPRARRGVARSSRVRREPGHAAQRPARPRVLRENALRSVLVPRRPGTHSSRCTGASPIKR